MKLSNLVQGWVSHAWKKEEALNDIIKLQKYFIILLCVVSLIFFIGWQTAPSRLTIYIPPDIQNGTTMKAGTIPSPLVYSFAYEIWQELNFWPKDGEADYEKNINDYWPYITPKFKTELLDEAHELKVSGQLQRIRYLQGKNGAAFEVTNVKKLGNDTWEVDLNMRLTEYKNNQPVKDINIIYPLKVTRVNVPTRINPFGLAIAGFVSEPKRLETYI